MQVSEKYLERFSVPPGEPDEILLNGYEQPATHVISVDDDQGTCLAVVYRDDYSADEMFDLKDGTDKRETFVQVRRGNDLVGSVGYRFAGLVKLDDLRAWYRRKFELDGSA